MSRQLLPKDFVLTEGTVLDNCDSTAGWVQTSINLSLNGDTHFDEKSSSLKLEQTVIGTSATIRKTGLNMDLSNLETVDIVFKISNRANLSSLRVALENSGSNYFYCYLPIQFSDMINNHGWYRMRISRSMFLAQGTPSWSSAFTGYGLRLSGNAGVISSILVDRLEYNKKAIPKIHFTYDDGWKSVLANAFPIHQELGQIATIWVMKNMTLGNDPNYCRLSELNTLQDAGWDVGNHTIGHDTYTTTPLPTLLESYHANQEWLVSEGFRGAYHACYPAGEFGDDLVAGLLQMGVKTARSTISGLTATPVDNLLKLKTYPLGSTTTRVDVMEILQRAMDTGGSVHFMLHRVEATPIPPIESICYPTAELRWLAETVKSMGFDVVNITEWYDQLTNPRKQVNRQ